MKPNDGISSDLGFVTTRNQIRGSSLLLLGRSLSLLVNFVAQVVMVRYLSIHDYGALAYGLAIVSFLEMFAMLGLPEALARFVPNYMEDREFGKLLGATLFAGGTVCGAGLLIVIVVRGWLSYHVGRDPLALALLSILIFLVPIDGADALLDGLFASLASTRDIFFRKYVLGPGFKLMVVAVLVWRCGTVAFLAWGYLVASGLGVLLYLSMLLRLFYTRRFLRRFDWVTVRSTAADIMPFIIPGLSSIVATAAIPLINIGIMGFRGALIDAAYYRAAVTVAGVNGVILASFTLLYTPSAARLFLRGDHSNINALYWQTAAWMSVLSFPIFAVTFPLARPLVVVLYGARYAPAGPVLALLSVGSYFNVALGLNLQTLKVLGRLRYVVAVSLVAIIADVLLNLSLIPRYGALGAAIGAAGALIGYNLLLQLGLRSTSGFEAFGRRYFSVYSTIALSVTALCLVEHFAFLSFRIALVLTACVSAVVLMVTKKTLSIKETFPELLRLPFARFILA